MIVLLKCTFDSDGCTTLLTAWESLVKWDIIIIYDEEKRATSFGLHADLTK